MADGSPSTPYDVARWRVGTLDASLAETVGAETDVTYPAAKTHVITTGSTRRTATGPIKVQVLGLASHAATPTR